MPVTVKTLVYRPERGCDVLTNVGDVQFDPSLYKTPQEAASAFFDALDTFATAAGYPEGSVGLWEPQDAEARGYGHNWMVTWEDGPYQWAINMSFQMTGPGWYTEPYHSFDLCFVS